METEPIPPSSEHINTPARSWAERNGFADWALALMWIIVAFIGFQVFAGIVAAVLVIAAEGPSIVGRDALDAFARHLDLVFIGNSSGQILLLGLATWLFARLHTSRKARSEYFRFKGSPKLPHMLIGGVILIIAVQPVIWFLGWLNLQVPVPESFEEMQGLQLQMIEDYLRGDHLMWLTLFHIAVVPAVCEEVLYRGYVLRSFEKSWGIGPAIVVSGVLFGLYHLQLSNLLPLAAIGILLAFITWISDSILPAMLAHFVNNGGSVYVASYYPESAFAELTPETMPPVWALLISIALSSWIIYWMYGLSVTNRQGGTAHV